MKLGGARNSLFQVNITNPVNGVADIQVPFMVKATNIPASVITPVPVKYFGREVKFAGSRTFEQWSTTVINDEDFAIRNALEEWQNAINSREGNLRSLGSASPVLYKSTAQVTQFSKTGVPVRVYNFVGLWPSNIAAIDLAWDSSDQIEEYVVTWDYDYWEVSGGITGRAGG
jgi:hypothetical protein